MAESLQTAHIMLRHIPEVDKQLVTAAQPGSQKVRRQGSFMFQRRG